MVRLDPPQASSQVPVRSQISSMARRLKHRPDYSVEEYLDSSGRFAVGRIGQPASLCLNWPNDVLRHDQASLCFIYGTVYTDITELEPRGQALLSVPQALKGSFALAVRGPDGSTLIASDRSASQPTYYSIADGALWFAPEVKALLAVHSPDRSPDLAAIANLLACGQVLGEQTLFRNVRRLRGGEALLIREGELQRIRYWRFSPGEHFAGETEGEFQEELIDLIRASIRRNFTSPQTDVILLSGGDDSRAILAGVLELSGRNAESVRVATWGTKEPRTASDVEIARGIGANFGLNLCEFERTTSSYEDDFCRTNYLLDGLSDNAAFHPAEYRIMEDLYGLGARGVLRGDEAFRKPRVYSIQGALGEIGLRRFNEAALLHCIVNRDVCTDLGLAADDWYDSLTKEYANCEPNDGKDRLYFEYRLQGSLNSAAYYKQVVLDHRNPLLDADILDFIGRVPWPLRLDKRLYARTIRLLYSGSNLWRYAQAARTNLENWANELSDDTPVRRFVVRQLADEDSGVWTYVNRGALRELLEGLRPVFPGSDPNGRGFWWSGRRFARAAVHRAAPRWAAEKKAQLAARRIYPHQIILRSMVLKHWCDEFVAR